MSRGAYVKTPEHIRKIAEANRGSTRSAETRQRISEAMKGRTAWNKGVHSTPWIVGKKHTPEALQKMSEAKKGNTNRLGKTFTLESRQKMSATKKGKHYSPATEFTSERATSINKGRVMSAETKQKLSEAKKGQIPWNKGLGTKSSLNELARKTLQARLWRAAVYERDNYTCQDCEVRGGKLHAHHIKPFALHPELRFALDNGLTLCEDCHRKTDTWGVKPKRKTG